MGKKINKAWISGSTRGTVLKQVAIYLSVKVSTEIISIRNGDRETVRGSEVDRPQTLVGVVTLSFLHAGATPYEGRTWWHLI